MDVMIGGQPAWLGMTAAAAAALVATITEGLADIAKKTTKATAAAGTPAATKLVKDVADRTAKLLKDAASQMSAGGLSINVCPLFPLPHVSGVVITPSQTVFINNWGACRVGDMIQEATAVNSIAMGEMTVIIGG